VRQGFVRLGYCVESDRQRIGVGRPDCQRRAVLVCYDTTDRSARLELVLLQRGLLLPDVIRRI
jgi:hypothetical protein